MNHIFSMRRISPNKRYPIGVEHLVSTDGTKVRLSILMRCRLVYKPINRCLLGRREVIPCCSG